VPSVPAEAPAAAERAPDAAMPALLERPAGAERLASLEQISAERQKRDISQSLIQLAPAAYERPMATARKKKRMDAVLEGFARSMRLFVLRLIALLKPQARMTAKGRATARRARSRPIRRSWPVWRIATISRWCRRRTSPTAAIGLPIPPEEIRLAPVPTTIWALVLVPLVMPEKALVMGEPPWVTVVASKVPTTCKV